MREPPKASGPCGGRLGTVEAKPRSQLSSQEAVLAAEGADVRCGHLVRVRAVHRGGAQVSGR